MNATDKYDSSLFGRRGNSSYETRSGGGSLYDNSRDDFRKLKSHYLGRYTKYNELDSFGRRVNAVEVATDYIYRYFSHDNVMNKEWISRFEHLAYTDVTDWGGSEYIRNKSYG